MTVRQLLMAQKVAPTTYATWNPSDKDADIALSGVNLVATGPNAGTSPVFNGVRSNIGKSSGKHYWEYIVTQIATMALGIGSATQTLSAASDLSDLEGLRVYLSNGSKYQPSTAFGASYTTGDVIGCKLDMDGGTFEMLKNNSSQGTLVSSLAGTFYAYVCCIGTGTPAIITAKFGPTFTYSVPGGYRAGLYTP